jgi:hypothetical protein
LAIAVAAASTVAAVGAQDAQHDDAPSHDAASATGSGAPPAPIGSAGGVAPSARTPQRSPLVGLSRPAADAPSEGVVLEVLPAGPYTYLRVARPSGGPDAWLATLGGGAPLGARVGIRSFGARADFPSKRLGRVFDRVDFALVTIR